MGEVPAIKIKHTKDDSCVGMFNGLSYRAAYDEVEGRQVLYINQKKNLTAIELFDTVAHEMIHQVQFIYGYELGHDKDFNFLMGCISRSFNVKLETEGYY